MAEINLHVNGKNLSVDTEPDTPLIYVLRNDFDFKGAKLGCALDQCGASQRPGAVVRAAARIVSEYIIKKSY